jgi:hypothetical protein
MQLRILAQLPIRDQEVIPAADGSSASGGEEWLQTVLDTEKPQRCSGPRPLPSLRLTQA